MYLGRQYRLRVHRSQNVGVKLIGRFLKQPVAKVVTAFDRPCIPADCVAIGSHTPGMLPPKRLVRRAQERSRCSRDFHHGLLMSICRSRRILGVSVLPLTCGIELTPCLLFRNRMDRCVESAPSLSGLCPDLRIRRMSKRWGSCSRKGTITLSLDLIKTPLHCIEYVITHELCHLLVHDHSPAFFRMLSRCMPDWERRKARLEEVVLR